MTDEQWLDIPYETRFLVTEYIFRKITENPGSFRSLIYGKLFFKCGEYTDLYEAGGMDITNAMGCLQDMEKGDML